MLNGAHSFLAYAGLMQGYSYVHEAISDLRIRTKAKQLMLDAGATLPAEVRNQVPDYTKALLARFDNPELAHRLDQIAMDGSQKLPYRFLDTLREGGSPMLIQAVRAWMTFCQEQTEKGIPLYDPKAKEIAQAVNSERSETALLEVIGATDLAPTILG
jgi:fructuronate reductase